MLVRQAHDWYLEAAHGDARMRCQAIKLIDLRLGERNQKEEVANSAQFYFDYHFS